MPVPGIGLPKLPVSKYDPWAKYEKYYVKPIGVRKVGDKKFMHNTTYEWTGSYWKCLDPSKRKFMQVRRIKGIEAKKKVLEEQLDLKPGSGMSYKALTEALAAGGMEAWRRAIAAGKPIPRVKVPKVTPDVTTIEGDYEVVAGQGIRDKATGKIIGYIGPNNQLMDLHGTVIGSYVGDRKTVTKVNLAKFVSVPERQGIPYCEEKNYEKAKEYLIKLMEAGEIPGGSTLVQRHGAWVYIPPKPGNETMKLESGEWIYKQEYDKLPTNIQDYLHKFGIKGFVEGYIPAQIWLAETTRAQYEKATAELKPFEVRGEVPAGVVNPAFVNYIKKLKGYDLVAAVQAGISDKTLALLFGKQPLAEAKKQAKLAPPKWETIEQSKPLTAFQKKYPEYWAAVTAEGGRFWVGTGGKIYFDFFVDGKRVKGAIPEGKIQKGIREVMLEQGYTIPTTQEFSTFQYDIDKWGWSLPKEHPIKSARIGFIITEAAIIATVAAPAIWAGVGIAGKALTPAILSRVGVGRVSMAVIPRIATALAQFTITATPMAITGATIAESLRDTDLDRKWEAFQEESATTQDYWAKQSGYKVKFDSLDEAQKANVLLHYSVPTGYTLAQWSKTLGEYDEKLVETSAKGADWLRERVHWRVSEPVVFAGGAAIGVARGIGFMAQLPLIAGQLTYEIPKGTAKEFSTAVILGMAAFFTTEIPKMLKADPVFGSGQLIGIFLLSPGSLLKVAKGLGVKPHPRYVPERGMAVEPNSVRIGLADRTVAEWYPSWQKLTKAQKLNIERELVAALTRSGKSKVTVKVYGTRYTIEALNVPYQRVVKNTLWAATTDITKFGDTVKIGRVHLFTSPELAVRFMLATSRGKVRRHPGVIEIHTSTVDKAFKLLRKGEAELEVPIQYKTLDAVKGFGGKGVSSNTQVGLYPIRRYTIRGEGLSAWKGPTGKQLTQVRVLAAKEGAIDALVGWHHRWKTIKQAFAKDPRVKKLDASIKQVKAEQPELTKVLKDGQHQILNQRRGIPHPSGVGMMQPRVKGIITRADGRVMLVKDRAGVAYELPGGSVNVKDIIIRGKFAKPEWATWEQALASQIKGETMVDLTKIKYLDLYLGKVHEHALSGARIFEAVGVGKANNVKAWNIYQRYKYGYRQPEVSSIVWWKVGDKGIEVLPATIDILKARVSTEGLRLYTGSKTLNKARDLKFANRVKEGKPINEANIKKINEAELKALKDKLNDLLKGESLTLREFITYSDDLTFLLEVIKGRRNALKYVRDGKITDAELKLLYKHPELMSQKAWKLVSEIQKTGRKLITKESNFLIKDLEKSFNDIMKWENNRLGKLKEEFEKAAYLENESYYNRAYSRYYYGLARLTIAVIGYAGRIPYQDESEIVRQYAKILDRDRAPIPLAVRRVMPTREKPPRIGIPGRIPPPKPVPEARVVPARIPPPKVPPTKPIPRILPPKARLARLTKKQREGIIAWKGGWCYKLIYSPYGVKDIINSRKPLAGVKYFSGPGSAARSIIAKHGEVPPEVLRDMGIMDVIIRTPWQKRSKPKIFFKRDIHQRTKTTPTTPGITGVR